MTFRHVNQTGHDVRTGCLLFADRRLTCKRSLYVQVPLDRYLHSQQSSDVDHVFYVYLKSYEQRSAVSDWTDFLS